MANQGKREGSGTSQRGFASMDPERQRQIASEGGRAAHQRGTAHEFTPEEARRAGSKGGQVTSQDREHMAAIGRKGGEASHGGRNRAREEKAGTKPASRSGSAQEAEGGTQGGSSEQHAQAGRQSHKNDE